MSVRTLPTPFLPEMIGDVVDMPSKDVYLIKTSKGVFTVHDSEIREFFYV